MHQAPKFGNSPKLPHALPGGINIADGKIHSLGLVGLGGAVILLVVFVRAALFRRCDNNYEKAYNRFAKAAKANSGHADGPSPITKMNLDEAAKVLEREHNQQASMRPKP